MIQKKCQIECRIAVPRHFAIQQNHTPGAKENILGAKIAMDQALASGLQPHGFLLKDRGERRMTSGCREKVRVSAKLMEDLGAVELMGEFGTCPRGGVNSRKQTHCFARWLGIEHSIQESDFPI